MSGFDERDVHGELAVPLDEFFRAVERIDEPKTFPLLALGVRYRFRLFGENRNGWVDFAQPANDAVVGGVVGERQR